MRELSGCVAIVTGAAKGLGEAIARTFSGEGARVVVADIDSTRGRAVAEDLGGQFRALDVASEDGWMDVIGSTRKDYGRIDVLVNNAGIFKPNIPFVEMSLATWREHFAVNADGVFLGCKHGIKAMEGQGRGSIINMASTVALMAWQTSAAYAASKASVLMITRLASRAGGPLGIRVNAILPGAVVTDQLRGHLGPGQTVEQFVEKILPLYPLGRLARPEDVAQAALFLASRRSAFVSGDLLRVDGAQDP